MEKSNIKISKKIYSIEQIAKIAYPIFLKYNIKNVYLFGSYARSEADENSDIDFMIKKDVDLTLFQLSSIAIELEQALKKQVDIVCEETYVEDIKYIKSKSLVQAKQMFYKNIINERVSIFGKFK